MGAAQLDLTQLELGHSQDITLELKDPGRPKQHLGEIYLTATLWPRNQQEKEQVLLRLLLGTGRFAKMRGANKSKNATGVSYTPALHDLTAD